MAQIRTDLSTISAVVDRAVVAKGVAGASEWRSAMARKARWGRREKELWVGEWGGVCVCERERGGDAHTFYFESS